MLSVCMYRHTYAHTLSIRMSIYCGTGMYVHICVCTMLGLATYVGFTCVCIHTQLYTQRGSGMVA